MKMKDISREVELEVIQLMSYEALCKNVGVTPRVEVTPGRDYDDDGELASWYEDKYYPEFTKVKQEKLLNYILTTEEAPSLIAHLANLLLDAERLDKDKIRDILEGDSLMEETDLKELIEDYYNTIYKAAKIKAHITKEILKPEKSEFTSSILDNEGLGTEEIYNILKEFIGE